MSALLEVSEYIRKITGLYFPAERLTDLERAITIAKVDFGFDNKEEFINWLLKTNLSEKQIKSLVIHLTIGETYFFRDIRSMEILRDNILPDLLPEVRQGKKTLKIWCAGCSTGEEPYSVAIMLNEFIPDYNFLDIKILASDINLNSLDKAKQGIYTDWSFRGTPSWVKFKYFNNKDKTYIINDKIKEKVDFSYVNLASESYPSIINNIHSLDIILCRNVLMYFDDDTYNTVINRFYKSLLYNGWFFVSAVEVSRNKEINDKFSVVNFPGLSVYKKMSENEYIQENIKPFIDREFLEQEKNESINDKDYNLQEYNIPLIDNISTEEIIEPDRDEKENIKKMANSYANQGLYEKAFELCNKGLSINKTDPDFHYIMFNIYNEKKETVNAVSELKKVLYLEPDHILANYSMASFYENNKDYKRTLKYLNLCQSILDKYNEDDIVPFSDDLNVKQMKYIIDKQIEKIS